MNDPASGLSSTALARLVHDARSHLRTVMVAAQRLHRGEHSAAELQNAIRTIVGTAKDLDNLLTSSVYFGTLAEAPQSLVRPIALSTVLQGLQLEQRPLIEGKGGELHVGEPPAGKVPAGLQWILRELVKNAIRFATAERLRIRIELTAAAGRLTVLVADNGPGIPSEFAEEIFQPYWRLHAGDTHPGLGLGLATARRIAAVCDGAIEILPVEAGTTVQVNWPLFA